MSNDTLQGGNGDDTIFGGVGDDVLGGGEGNDSIAGEDGNDTLSGGNGNDLLNGGSGLDLLVGGEGRDTIDGGSNFDTVDYSAQSTGVSVNLFNGTAITGGELNSSYFYVGGALEDTISNVENVIGSSFGDRIIAGSTSSALTGGDGDDFLFALSGNDSLSGGSGNDSLSSGRSNDTLDGGAGDDTLLGGTGLDTIIGGTGVDTVSYSDRTGGVSVNLFSNTGVTGGALNSGGFYAGGFVEDQLSSIENITGSAFGDRLVGASGGSVLSGLAGADRISGANGNDTIIGGLGIDTLEGRGGIDTVDYSSFTSGSVNVNLINGTAFSGGTVGSTGFYSGGTAEDILSGFENIIGTSFGDRLIGATTALSVIDGRGGSDAIFTFSSSDLIFGGDGNDTISSAQNFDTIFGGAGDDLINAGTGFDTIDGGTGVDTADYSDRTGGVSVNLIEGVARTAGVLNSSGFYSGGFNEDSLTSIEAVLGSAFDDRLVGLSDAATRLDGRGGNDRISSFAGNDILLGGVGKDTLEGGSGNDQLTGGEDVDTFHFAFGDCLDTITDFEVGLGSGDVVRLAGFGSAFDTFAEVLAAASDNGGNTTIDFGGGDQLVLVGVLVSGLNSDDFLFV